MLEQSEIDLLTKSKEEIYRATREIFGEEESITGEPKYYAKLKGTFPNCPNYRTVANPFKHLEHSVDTAFTHPGWSALWCCCRFGGG